ncbi:4-hydroxythreonine-4-phosphate dehydrogenase PdxA [Pseudolabrys taiwanensis]|uniref:4-hydroxythreonine-4-phosphate dehydrogenase n=1 Tax=Pseudolabrys taiwanensis TaxID=331696 RepID=A0A345ZUB5_9HYPH|nr:4-hydroxythreonine-4-phosphate dehydrogenase PdxA [Pseudolabrys taiwanensis]AXK80512.1 4-hydroxythreonine-4-phosphate dehydrogenase PdxA [Pseudolabrys taiwanensis]
MSDGLPLALTLGEPAGIGPDLSLAVWLKRRTLHLPPFYIVGDLDFLAERARLLKLDVPLKRVDPNEAASVFDRALPVVSLDAPVTARPGKPDDTSAPAAIASIRRAVADVLAGDAAAVVTNPIAKNVLYRADFADPGHTEFLARLAQEATGQAAMPVMLLWAPELAVVPVTIHIPLRNVIAELTTDLIVRTGRIVAHDMERRFGVARPRLAVAGLNPHAGEDGTIGDEDRDIVAPAVRQLQADGIDARGPLPADTLFHDRARALYDVALCMYHDQALIPIKTLAFDHGVNVTLGLPFVRTSPDHGTAFGLAGTGTANPASLIAALKLAARLTESAPALVPVQ